MAGLVLKIIYRFMVGVIGMSAGMAFVVVLLVLARGAGILRDRTFLSTIEIVAFFIPFSSAIFVIPNAIREHREGGSREKSIFEEPD